MGGQELSEQKRVHRAMWQLAACVLAIAVAMEFVPHDSADNTHYGDSFTEHRNAPGNAYSSLIYAVLAIYLVKLQAPRRARARATEVVVLAWFAYLSVQRLYSNGFSEQHSLALSFSWRATFPV